MCRRNYWSGLMLLVSLGVSKTYAQDPFVVDTALSAVLPQSLVNSISLADMDNDGTTDLILSGYDTSRFGLFMDVMAGQEDGSLDTASQWYKVTYSDTIAEFFGGIGNIDLADYNRDGWLDLYLNGSANSSLFINNGTTGALNQSTNLAGGLLSYSNGHWGDVNMDGALDVFIMAVIEGQDIILNSLQLNDNGDFSEDPTTIFPELTNGGSAWGDYDNDGDPDIVIGGQTANPVSSVTRFYQNEPIGRLIEDTNQDLIGLKGGAYCFADLDGDGDLDLIMSGWNVFEGLITRIYVNEPLGTFSLADEQLDFGVVYGTIDAVDFNLDGKKDLVIAGADSATNAAGYVTSLSGQVFLNDGDLSFTRIKTIPGARTARFGDINQDLMPDLVVNGTTQIGNGDSTFCRIYINSTAESNQPPQPPTALTAFAVSTRAVFTWGYGSDDHDDPGSISYNLRIGSSPGGNDLLSSSIPMHINNVGPLLVREFNEIPHGDYYWSVQSVDAAGGRSDWSNEESLFIARLVPSTQSLPGVYFSTAGWGDYNEDNLLDLALTGITFSGGSITNMFQNDGGLLNQDLAQNIQAVFGGHLSLVDYTNDGHLDLSLSGFQIINFQPFPATVFYKWDNGVYIQDLQDGVTYDLYGYTMGYNGGSNNHSWGDYDNDGDFDLVAGGVDFYGSRHLKVFKNDGGSLVQDLTQTDLVPLFPCMVHWCDMNRDGFLDLVTVGADSNGTLFTQVYVNGPNYKLDKSLMLFKGDIGVTAGAFDFGDYNSDGYIDFAITGKNSQNNLVTYIIRNYGAQIEAEIVGLNGIFSGRPAWGDYDNDGDLDLIVSGLSNVDGSDPVTIVYQQNNGSFFEDTSLDLDGVGFSFSDWGDYDGDGDLDLFLAGFKANEDVMAQVYDNLEGIENANNAPNAPYGLDDSSISGDQITLRWTAPVDPANDGGGFTPQEGLLYQLQVGGYTDSTENEHEIITGHYGVGEIGTTNLTAKKLRNMPEGNYKWRVRALDHGGAGSEWTNWNYFYIDVTAPAIETIRANYVTNRQVILVIKFNEAFFLDTAIDPLVQVTHPVNADLNNDNTPDTLTVMKQSFNVDEWTGMLLLPDNDSLRYTGKAIQIHVSGVQDERLNKMERTSIYKTPESIISQYGGTSISKDGNVSVLLPQNAVNKDIKISISSIGDGFSFGDSTQLITDLYTITIDPVLAFNKPGILRIAYSDSALSDSVLPFIGRITSNELQLLGGSPLTIQNEPYMQVQVDTMGIFGVFTTQITLRGDSLDTESLICQPRIFSPAGSVFEFANTNILFNLDEQEEVTARIFNLAGRLKWTQKPESTQRGSNVLNWDGKDYNGNVVTSGLYIVTLEKGDSVLRTTVGVLNR